jgi:radical SAM superfamily enzyme YgiQ (UPF0313 family)
MQKSKIKTLFINLPWKANGRLGVRAGSRWPFTSLPEKDGKIHYKPFPFFLAYATSLLKKNGFKARLIDAIAENSEIGSTLQAISADSPDIIVIETAAACFENDLSLIGKIKQENKDLTVVLCGSYASVAYEQILLGNDQIDYILIGEYENTVLELVKAIDASLCTEGIPGIAYKKNNNIVSNPWRELIDLDLLPWPERTDVPIYNYNDGFAGLPQPNVQIWSSRGCPYQCTFCLWPQTLYRSNTYRMRDPVDVVDEMEYLVKNFDFKAVYFDDDVFNANKNHFYSITEQIQKRDLNIPWAIMARADLMDKNMLAAAKSAGLYAVKYGIESADEDILKNCKKNLDLNKARQAIQWTKNSGIKVHLSFCLGLPGETLQTAEATKQFIKEMQPDSFQLSLATAFHGTEYFKYASEHNLLKTVRLSDYDAAHKSTVKSGALECSQIEGIKVDIDCYFNAQ